MAQSQTLNYDALLVLSFGGPEAEDEVVPFLQNVTRGRGIPVERLAEVGEHYYRFGGKSPLNTQNIAMISNIRHELKRQGLELPVYYGTRNWHPFVEDTAEHMARAGVRRCLVFATSAWGGYSGSQQYDEDIQRVRQHLRDKNLPEIEFVKLRQFFNHPIFINEFATGISNALAELSPKEVANTRIIFTAHSVPLTKPPAAGIPSESEVYEAQVREATRLVAAQAGITDYDLVWQSRSGAPHIPWLEPDVVDFITELEEKIGLQSILICPIGFITDHMEVMWDLDTELKDACDELGIAMKRVGTPGTAENFSKLVIGLIQEAEGRQEIATLGELPAWGASVNGRLIDAYPQQ
ncbi:ferrochelatase [Corynebacterium caspium]|uniref:ferrochelatase n=1 Tax=Corynebacterium caspium TaxID=234828 RepID=UPI0004763D9D|nr:ferrochelatase [Corynebacterium caspium]WKD59280.1 Ferrochelatase [Corynebacterium caspium DSM 44850]